MLSDSSGPIVLGVSHVRESDTYELMGVHTYSDLAQLCLHREEYRGKYISSKFKLSTKSEDPVYFFKLLDLEKDLVLDNYSITNELCRDAYEFYEAIADKLGSFKLDSENESVTVSLPKTFDSAVRYRFVLKYHQPETFINRKFLQNLELDYDEPDWLTVIPETHTITNLLSYAFERSIFLK